MSHAAIYGLLDAHQTLRAELNPGLINMSLVPPNPQRVRYPPARVGPLPAPPGPGGLPEAAEPEAAGHVPPAGGW